MNILQPLPVTKIETVSIKLDVNSGGLIVLTHQFRIYTTFMDPMTDSSGKIIPPSVITRTTEMDKESTALSLYLALRQGMELDGRLLLPSHWAKCVRSGPFSFEEAKQRWSKGEGSFIDKPVAKNLFYFMTYEGVTESEKTDHRRLREIHYQLHFEDIPEGVFKHYMPSP